MHKIKTDELRKGTLIEILIPNAQHYDKSQDLSTTPTVLCTLDDNQKGNARTAKMDVEEYGLVSVHSFALDAHNIQRAKVQGRWVEIEYTPLQIKLIERGL